MKDALKQFDFLNPGTNIRVQKIYRIGRECLVSFDVAAPANESRYDHRECFSYNLYDLNDRVFESGLRFDSLEGAKQDVLARMSHSSST